MANDAPNNWREARRLRAFELSQEGWTGVAIAMALGVTEGVVSQWLRRAREGGKGALRTRKGTGRPPRLAQDKLERLAGLLVQGPEHSGFRGQVWTRARVREVIRLFAAFHFLPNPPGPCARGHPRPGGSAFSAPRAASCWRAPVGGLGPDSRRIEESTFGRF